MGAKEGEEGFSLHPGIEMGMNYPSARVSSDGGEVVADREPIHFSSDGGGGGRQREPTPPVRVSSDGGGPGGGVERTPPLTFQVTEGGRRKK